MTNKFPTKIGLLLNEGYNFVQTEYIFTRLQEEGFQPEIISVDRNPKLDAERWDKTFTASHFLKDSFEVPWELLILPGGVVGNAEIYRFLRETYRCGAFVAAIDTSVNVLLKCGILENKLCSAPRLPFVDILIEEAGATRSQKSVTLHQRILTAEQMVHVPVFILKILEILGR